MKTPVVVDFESYYDKEVSVINLGNDNYVAQSYAYMLSVVADGFEFCGTIEEFREQHPDILQEMCEDPDIQIIAANSNFDRAWWTRYYGPTAKDWFCVLDYSAFKQWPRNLSGLVKRTLGDKMDKSMRDEMRAVHYRDLDEDTRKRMIQYCLDDSRLTFTCYQRMVAAGDFSPVEQEVASHTRLLNRRGVRIDTDRVQEDKEYLETAKWMALQGIPWTTGQAGDFTDTGLDDGEGDKPLSIKALGLWCQEAGQPLPKSLDKRDQTTEQMLRDNPALGAVVAMMRQYRRANTLLRKLETLESRVRDDGIMPLDLLYCGAPHTRRWSSKGFNVQNLDAETVKFEGVPGRGVWTRGWIIPREGKKFLIADYAQIEPRCINWLVGNDEMLDAVRMGFSVYEAYARSVGAWSGTEEMKHANPKKYKIYKALVLGMGYGMGATRFADTNPGLFDTQEEYVAAVKEWRRLNPKITGFWSMLDQQIKQTILKRETELAIELPTGDYLKHFYLKAKRGSTGVRYTSSTVLGEFRGNAIQNNLWGGTLTENVTQRMARDVMAEAILRLEKSGVPVVFSAHDEIIMEVPTDWGDDEMQDVLKIMEVTPDWCPDLPVTAEAGYCDRYTKL